LALESLSSEEAVLLDHPIFPMDASELPQEVKNHRRSRLKSAIRGLDFHNFALKSAMGLTLGLENRHFFALESAIFGLPYRELPGAIDR
jgi:hypothetical protein